MTEILIKSNKKITYRVVYLIAIIGSLLLSISFFNKFNPNSYTDAINIIVAVLFLIFAIICIYGLISVKNYYISNQELIIKSFFGIKSITINNDEIEYWTEIPKNDKYNRWVILSLFTKVGKEIKISSNYYSNFNEVKNYLIKNKKRNQKVQAQKQIKEIKKSSIILMLFGVVFLFSAFMFFQIKEINSSEISVIGDITSKKIELIIGRKHSRKILIKLKSFPEFNFQISGANLRETYSQDLINDINVGDSIFLGISKDDYRKKLMKIDSLSLSDKYFHYEIIHVESVKSKAFEYLSLSDNNIGRKDNKYWGFAFFMIPGLIMFVIGIKIFYEYLKKRPSL